VTPRPRPALRHLLGIVITLVPLAVCIAAGTMNASLWLDEITYWYYEDDPSLRELETGRPGDRITRYYLNFFYCDIQRVAHAISEPLGLTLHRHPELYLRLLSTLCFMAMVALVYFVTYRESRSWLWSVTAALVPASSPLLLFYAFEGRVSAFAALGVTVYLVLAAAALRHPSNRRLWLAGALLGIFLTHTHLWIVCLYAGFGMAGLIRCALQRTWREFPVVLSFTLPGALSVVAESLYVVLHAPSGGHPFPLYLPRSLASLQERTLGGLFSAGVTAPPFPLELPIALLGITIVMLLVRVWKTQAVLFPVAAVLSLVISVGIGATAGYLIAPRYQVPLFAALFVALSVAPARAARLLVGAIVALQFLMLPKVITDVANKANGKEIAAVIASETPRAGTAVVVQHGLRFGYPDPLHSFVLHFYLDELQPNAPAIPLYELPSLRNVTGERGLGRYFGGGPELLEQYAALHPEEWRAWLANTDARRIWLVTPVPVVGFEDAQAKGFRNALREAGFAVDASQVYRFEGHPPTYAGLFVRR
jgi:hypothetical protein